jgi:signal peptidase I
MKNSMKIKPMAILLIVVGFLALLKYNFPVYKISSESMSPLFNIGDVVLINRMVEKKALKYNDICIFSKNKGKQISRIVGLPGDEIEIKDGVLYVNDIEVSAANESYIYQLKLEGHLSKEATASYLLKPLNQFNEYQAMLSKKQAKELSKLKEVRSIHQVIHPTGYELKFSSASIYPNLPAVNWSNDNFGPITIPEIGDEMGEDQLIIQNYYYFVLGDNRSRAIDSRYFGLISAHELEGKLISKF